MKTINFELSKRLTEWLYLDNIETEFKYYKMWDEYILLHKTEFYKSDWDNIKTLTLEEAIEFLPIYIKRKYKFNCEKFNNIIPFSNMKKWDKYWVSYIYNWEWYIQYSKTLLGAIEKMLEYLLDNNLIWK